MNFYSWSITQVIPLISAIFVFWLGFFVLSKNWRSELSITFSLFTLAVTGWLFCTFMLLISTSNPQAVFWEKFIYTFVILIPAVLYHFSVVFVEKKKKSLIVLTYITFILILLINVFTNYFTEGIFHYRWGIHSEARLFHHIFLFLFFIYSFEVYRLFIVFYRKSKGFKKQQAKLIFFGLLNFGTIGFTGFLPAYGISVIPIAYVSGILFAIIAGYAITRYRFLDVRVFAAQFLIVVLNIVAFSYIFVSKSVEEYVVKFIFFIGILITSYLLKRSFEKELKQRQELEVLAKELKRANARLKKLDEAKTEFLSIASHQLRTPLTAIKGYLSLIDEGLYGKVNKDVEEVLGKIHISNERLIGLVEDLLNISRIEAGRMQYSMKEVQICDEIMKDLRASFELRAEDKGLKLIFNKPKIPVPKVMMDKNKIREVISNIIDNAIKYTEKGHVEVKVRKTDGNIRVTVTDTGIGIPKSEIPYLFKKFSRGKDTKRLNADGTGLGIYLAKKIIKDHNGKIYIESKGKGKGSTFVIELPIVNGEIEKADSEE
ncbi:MAG: ATP-binding protein [Candidatus Moranbacteria bacterium]|nr:ATP-binding protein [Candidatus Moranbacteria bacterium]